jgi:ATP-dependent Clp protease ATP-binding subunit ClpC
VQREIEDSLAEKMLYGEVGPGQTVKVDVEGEGPTAAFTFHGTPRAPLTDLDDLPPIDTLGEVEPAEVGPADND